MKIYKPTQRQIYYVEQYNNSCCSRLSEAYTNGGSYEKQQAEVEILAEMYRTGGRGYRICSASHFFFSCGYRITINGLQFLVVHNVSRCDLIGLGKMTADEYLLASLYFRQLKQHGREMDLEEIARLTMSNYGWISGLKYTTRDVRTGHITTTYCHPIEHAILSLLDYTDTTDCLLCLYLVEQLRVEHSKTCSAIHKKAAEMSHSMGVVFPWCHSFQPMTNSCSDYYDYEQELFDEIFKQQQQMFDDIQHEHEQELQEWSQLMDAIL